MELNIYNIDSTNGYRKDIEKTEILAFLNPVIIFGFLNIRNKLRKGPIEINSSF